MIFKQSSLTLKGFSNEYKPLFEEFFDYLRKQGLCDNSIITWRGRLFCLEYFLLNRNSERFEQIEIPHINEYIESLAGFSNSTISATLGCFRRLFAYAYENGYHAVNYAGAIPTVRRTKEYRLPNIFTPDDVAKILESSNREYPIGKCNFAVLMLVARTGLRISDARELKFSAIDWDAKTISVIRKKTRKPLELPLFEDVGWAIIDYLKHGRPIADCEYMFVSHQAPYTKLSLAFQKTVVEAVCKAGINIDANKPIGMHTFRHSIATAMLASGAKITDIAPALGHAEPKSTERYINTTVDMLR